MVGEQEKPEVSTRGGSGGAKESLEKVLQFGSSPALYKLSHKGKERELNRNMKKVSITPF